jgi:thiol-disulfide isomerase/thioredoxin
MTWQRITTLSLGILALLVLYFQLPETPNPFDLFGCKICVAGDPYMTLVAAGYFSALLSFAMLFPKFFRAHARAGLLWAVLLALVLTYLKLPQWCFACLIAHACHIGMWTIWACFPFTEGRLQSHPLERLCLALALPVAIVALFSTLNLTRMAYHAKANDVVAATDLQIGDLAPPLGSDALKSGLIVNFVSPSCPYCEQQLRIIDKWATTIREAGYRFVNISATLPAELTNLAPSTEWHQDVEGSLRRVFKVHGYPTLFVIRPNGKIVDILPGVSERLKELGTLLPAID